MKINLRVSDGRPQTLTVKVYNTTPIQNFAEKVKGEVGMPVTAFNLEYNGTLLRKTENYEAKHVEDYGLVNDCTVDVVILAEERKYTHASEDEKFPLDFQFEDGSVITLGSFFHLGTNGQTFNKTANRELGRKFPKIRFDATYFVGENDIPNSSIVRISERGVTTKTFIRVKLTKSCKDRVLEMLKNGFQAELQKSNFATVDELIEHHKPELFKMRMNVPREVSVVYGVVVRKLVAEAKTASEILASLIYTGTVSTSLASLIEALKARFDECCCRMKKCLAGMKLKPEDLGLVILFSSQQLDGFHLESTNYAMEAVELAIGDIFKNAKDNGVIIFHEKFANGTGCSSKKNGNYFLSRKLLLMTKGEYILQTVHDSIEGAEYVIW